MNPPSGPPSDIPGHLPAAAILAEIRAAGPPELGPGELRDGAWRQRLRRITDEELLGASEIRDRDAAGGVRAGLLLFGGDLERSHEVSQTIETPDGSFWHAIMHRREPDYSNAKYWFRRAGRHPVLDELAAAARGRTGAAVEILAGGSWDPFRMVDLVEACERGRRPELRRDLLELQEIEMLALLSHCYRAAAGGGR